MAAILPAVADRPFYSLLDDHIYTRSVPILPANPIAAATLAVPDVGLDRRTSSDPKAVLDSIQVYRRRARDENDPFVESPRSVSKQVSSRQSSNQNVSRDASWSTVVRTRSDAPSPHALHIRDDLPGRKLPGAETGQLHERIDIRDLAPPLTLPVDEKPPQNAAEPMFKIDVEKTGSKRLSPQAPRQRPFQRLMSRLRRRNSVLKDAVDVNVAPEVPETGVQFLQAGVGYHRHERSSSHSSGGVLSIIKSATSVKGSTSGVPPRKTGAGQRRSWARSSEVSNAPARISEDGGSAQAVPLFDEGVWKRATQRRRILEELISSEESYIADMKILINVYFALLGSVPALSHATRNAIQRNAAEILALHEELLGELHRVIPNAEVNQGQSWRGPGPEVRDQRHLRPGSSASNFAGDKAGRSKRKVRRSDDAPHPTVMPAMPLCAEPEVAGKVAQVFASLMKRFLAYEEYGAKYEMMVHDVASTYKTIPTWHAYERGIEALANSLTSVNKDESPRRKGLTFEDLIIKPIQRVCRYPLLFAELYKATPVCDCPESHTELEKVLYRLREVAGEINRATHDPQTRDRIEKTWLLQDRLVFTDELPSGQTAALRHFGRVILCGALHVAWQSRTGIHGEFMVCILFPSYLMLAVARDLGQAFWVVACISLENLKIEAADSGKGLQCHTALFTWKIIFEQDYRLHEIIVSACSAKEEEVWKSALHERSVAESTEPEGQQSKSPNLYASLALEIKASGTVFGQPGTLARRLSIHRATTLGAKSNLGQVIIKNTHALRDGPEQQVTPPINRTQSLLSTARIPVLAPQRADRIRLEHALTDLWTKDVIPYPGMGGKRSDSLIKASASSMMRKLSMSSLFR